MRRPATNHPGFDARAERPHEMPTRHRFAVHEHEVVRLGCKRAEIQDSGEAKSLVRLPGMGKALSEG